MKVRLLVLLISILLPTVALADGLFVKENKKSEMGREPFNVSKYPPFQDVKFSFKSATVNPKYYDDLDQVIRALNEDPHLRVSVLGFSDDSGSHSENMKISKLRAMNIEEYLVGRGLPTHRVEIGWYGDNKPLVASQTEKGHAQNRRATVTLFRRDALKELPKDLGITE